MPQRLMDSPWTLTLREVEGILAPLGVEWAVFGAVAANVYRAEARATYDVDILLSLGRADMGEVAEAARAAGWTVRLLHPDESMLRIVHPEFGAVDFVAVEIEYQRAALQRARKETLAGGISTRVLAVEDIIIHKLIAGRSRDDADVEAIVDVNHDLDRGYLDHWLDQWEVADRFAALQKKAMGTVPPPSGGSDHG